MPMNIGGLVEAIGHNTIVAEVIGSCPDLALPDYFVSAGCVAQTVWNLAHHRDPASGIKDIDIVYFDPHLLEAREEEVQGRVREHFARLPVAFDVKNEARVHLWYHRKFGYDIPPYTSVEDAIASFPSTATAVGLRRDGEGYTVCAPFGLDDLFNLIVRPNKRQVTREVYERKVERWRKAWPRLKIVSWDEVPGS